MSEIKKEEWKDVTGFEDIYQISSHGRLKSFKRIKSGYILSNKNKTGGYLSVVIESKTTNTRHTRIHRLVAECFIPNHYNKPQINHKDWNKQNNNISNLEWATSKENYDHARKNGLVNFKEMNHYNQKIRPKEVCQYTLKGRLIECFCNCKEASIGTGVCHRNIHQVASKTEYKPGLIRNQAGGFKWGFANEN